MMPVLTHCGRMWPRSGARLQGGAAGYDECDVAVLRRWCADVVGGPLSAPSTKQRRFESGGG